MHEVIVCEKPTSAEKIAKALSPSAKKKVYNKTIEDLKKKGEIWRKMKKYKNIKLLI